MHTDPTIVHAAADLRRQALLSEAADGRRMTPPGMSKKFTGPGKGGQRMVAQIAAVVSRVIDDFEPIPKPQMASTPTP